MSESTGDSGDEIDIVLPKEGLLYQQHITDFILCKPKLIPLKSVTLEKLEKMQRDAEQKMKESQKAESSPSKDE